MTIKTPYIKNSTSSCFMMMFDSIQCGSHLAKLDRARSLSLFQPPFIEKLVDHILAYAEMLFRWELLQQRLELLKSISQELQAHVKHTAASEQNHLGFVSLCTQCENDTTPRGHRSCSSCHARLTMPLCSICRLPVKGDRDLCTLASHH